MLGEVIVIGDLKLRDGASREEYDRLGASACMESSAPFRDSCR